jgi:serine/threonine protein kinase
LRGEGGFVGHGCEYIHTPSREISRFSRAGGPSYIFGNVSGSETAVDAAIPKRIGRYDVLVPLGSGGMATVYLARAEVVSGVSREYAVKLMHAHLRGDPDWATHLLHEAKIAARIRHPNVVQVVEAGDDPLGLFLVLEYIEGDTLSGLTRALRKQQKLLPLQISGKILLDSLAGLHAAHELRDESGAPLQLVHRDFSPQNILVGVDGVGRLTDFGIAKQSGGQVTATGMLKGKVSYMSPEQARGRPVDRRCDVWAAGVIAWELLAGQRLYPNRNDTETLLEVVSKTPPRLREMNPDIPAALDELVAEALTPDVTRRCPDARIFRERLEQAWRAHVGLADAQAIGPFVAEAVRDTLAERKSALARETTSRSKSGDSMVLGPLSGPDGEGVTAFQFTALRRRRAITMGAGSAVLLFGAALGGIVLLKRSADVPPSVEADPPVAATSPVESAAPTPTGTEAPRAATLIVRANRDIARVRVGRRNVQIPTPKKQVEISLSAEESGVPLGIEVTSDNGAMVTADVGAHQGSVSVRFADGGRPVVRPKPKPTDELAPTPFPKKKP